MRLLPNWCLKNPSVNPSAENNGVAGGGTEGGGSVFLGNSTRLEALANFTKSKSTRTHLTNALVTVVGVAVVGVSAYLSRDYVRWVLLWVAVQKAWVVVLVFLALFTLVSLPFVWGYIVVNVSAGYMFGTWRGLAVTLSTATAGVFLAHILIRVCLREVVHRRVVTSRLLRALLAVLGGPQAFKVVFVTRLTPIPFGLQNAVFAVSRVPTWLYLAATVVGLLPTQVLNCYLGTTVRNLDDVVSQSPSASATGWGVFAVQIVISIGLTMWVVRRAKAELHKTMAAQLSDDTQPTLCSPAHSTRTPTNSATHTPAHTPAHTPSRASSRTSNGHANFPVDIASSHLTKITGVNYGYDDDDVVGGNGADDELILAAGVSPNTSLSTSTIITTSNTSSFSLRTTSSTNTTTTSTTTFRRDSADDIFILVDSPA